MIFEQYKPKKGLLKVHIRILVQTMCDNIGPFSPSYGCYFRRGYNNNGNSMHEKGLIGIQQ